MDWPREAAAGLVCFVGMFLSAVFTTNWGWILIDMVDHYTADFIFIFVGFAQCVSVGWLFEYRSTCAFSEGHKKSLNVLTVLYWVPVFTICFYGVFAQAGRIIPLVVAAFFILVSLFTSFKVSEMPFSIWYHDILMCGVEKLSMSITSLSYDNPAKRSWWMPIFELYFGITIKFLNPAVLLLMLIENIFNDISTSYGGQSRHMQMFSSIFVYLALLLIFGGVFACGYPQVFTHNVAKEFEADEVYCNKLQKQMSFTKLTDIQQNRDQAQPLNEERKEGENNMVEMVPPENRPQSQNDWET